MTSRMPEYMSDEMSENMSDRMPDRLPDRMPGGMSGYMPDRMPEYMPEYMSDRMSEYTKYMSKYTSWHVMVGITRSRVILLVFLLLSSWLQYKMPIKAYKSTLPDSARALCPALWNLNEFEIYRVVLHVLDLHFLLFHKRTSSRQKNVHHWPSSSPCSCFSLAVLAVSELRQASPTTRSCNVL